MADAQSGRRVPRLLVITDRRRARMTIPELARRAIEGGADAVQIREKDLLEEQLLALSSATVDAVGEPHPILVNGSLSVAQALGIGLHLPESGGLAVEARAILGEGLLIGRSVHSVEAARESTGADFLIAGHVFPTASKPDLPPIGLNGLAEIAEASAVPVLAIGGIDESTIDSAREAGAYGVAVVSAINGAQDPETAARSLKTRLFGALRTAMTEQATSTAITATVNGKATNLAGGTTIQQFLASRGLHERLVVVELNESILPREAYPSTVLVDGDRLEIVHFVGGG